MFRRVLQRINDKPKGHFSFKKLRGTCGICEWDDGIKIDPRKQLIPTIIHEVLHDLYPKDWEGIILRLESKIVNILTPYDIYILLTLFFDKLDLGKKSYRKTKKVKKMPLVLKQKLKKIN
jgi:hypothetical protein